MTVEENDKGKDIFVKKFVLGPLESNSYIIASKKTKDAALIDPCLPTDLIKETINKFAFKLNYIINTHGHIDHIQGNSDFNLPIYIHKEDKNFLKDSALNLSQFLFGSNSPSMEASKLLNEGDFLKLGDIELKIIHTPGHTPGGICIYFDGLLLTGDTLFYDGIGRCDLSYGSQKQLLKSIKEKLLILPDETIVYPGHGPETTIGREKKHNPFL